MWDDADPARPVIPVNELRADLSCILGVCRCVVVCCVFLVPASALLYRCLALGVPLRFEGCVLDHPRESRQVQLTLFEYLYGSHREQLSGDTSPLQYKTLREASHVQL